MQHYRAWPVAQRAATVTPSLPGRLTVRQRFLVPRIGVRFLSGNVRFSGCQRYAGSKLSQTEGTTTTLTAVINDGGHSAKAGPTLASHPSPA